MAMVVAGALFGAGCGDSKNTACDPAARPTCLDGVSNGACADVAHNPTCAGTQWVCPSGTIPQDECACLGPPPGACTCTTTGWSCPPDAGTD